MDADSERELRRLERDRRRREHEKPPYFSGAIASVAVADGARAAPNGADGRELQLGWLPLLGVTTALGLLLVTLGNAASRQTVASLQLLFWVGILLTYVPVVFRLLSSSPRRGERVLLVVLLGLALYLVTVLWAPFGFTGPDELAHQQNANTILETHRLFHPTSILPISADYPGLEAVTTALASLSGLTTFGAGLVVIGAARIVMMLALFLLFERLSGSSRVAAVGAAVYAANENFVFFDAQFSYGSLAVPLLLAVLAAVAEWRSYARVLAGTPPAPGPARRRHSWATVAVLLIIATVVTHHVTSYVVAGLLVALCALYAAHPRTRARDAPLMLTGVAVVAVAVWMGTVARPTVHYLWPVLHGAVTGTVQMILGQEAPRELFARAGYRPSWLERGTAILSWILLGAGCALGLRSLLRKHRDDPFAILLAVVGVAFFGTLAGRYVAAAWETADRASGFLFIGLAFVIASIDFERWLPRQPRAFVWGLTSVLLGVCFAGGVIQGWDPKLRLAQPYVVEVNGREIPAEGRQLADYAAAHLQGRRFAASNSDARLLAVYAGAYAITGGSPDLNDILRSTDFPVWQQRLLRDRRLRYVVTDRRERSFDNSNGYYFGVRPPFGKADVLLPERVVAKFEKARLSKLYDSGNIAVFEYRWRSG